RNLTALVPKHAIVEQDGQTMEVLADSLQPNATVLVRPGDRIAADGLVLDGEGAVDESPVTGESIRKIKVKGDSVFAGTINGDSAFRIRVTATAANNTIARVVQLVEQAQSSKAPTERFIDRFSRFYTPTIVFVGAMTACIPPLLLDAEWIPSIYKGLAVLLIGCPCALVISTPAAVASALASGARSGLLFKGGAVLEAIGQTTIAAFDKTGTLTTGKPILTDILAFDRDESDVLSIAAALAVSSNHPFSRAIVDRATNDNTQALKATEVVALGGKGVVGKIDDAKLFLGSVNEARTGADITPAHLGTIEQLCSDGKTVSVLLVDGKLSGILAVRDELKSDAASGIAYLARQGIRSTMLTGDNHSTAQAIANTLGIEFKANLLPEDKLRAVMEWQDAGQRVAKIGDGINDAPALAGANVGIAMGQGSDVALETSDAAVLHGRVSDVAEMVHLSRRTLANIHQNLVIALGLKLVFLATTVAGVTGLWPAVLADTGATVLVTINALRLLRRARPGG
ncbi:MAG: heavy metal translocating P-type ATPase, partial [Polyangiaceae bacterium]|nr:heavy metal translocating P-type ATPase [Polyangiaceae bacterium]